MIGKAQNAQAGLDGTLHILPIRAPGMVTPGGVGVIIGSEQHVAVPLVFFFFPIIAPILL